MKLHVNPRWVNVDVDDLATNWTVDQDGVDRRQGCRARAGTVLAQTTNSFAATHPRTLFFWSMPINATGAPSWPVHVNSAVDMLEFLWEHQHQQGRDGKLRSIVHERLFLNVDPANTSTWVDTYLNVAWASVYGAAADGWGQGRVLGEGTNAINYFWHSQDDFLEMNVGNPTNLAMYGTVKNYNGYRPIDIVIQEPALAELDSAMNHSYARLLAKSGAPVLADQAEEVRRALHQIRTQNLPMVFCWSSMGGVPDPDWTSPGSIRGMAVQSNADGTGWVNLLDHSITARNTNTPGVTAYAEKCGLGVNAVVPITCYVLGHRNSADADCLVRFESKWSNATANISHVYGGSLGWVGVTGLAANSLIDDDDVNNDNKIDIFGIVGDDMAMTIYALVGIVQYS